MRSDETRTASNQRNWHQITPCHSGIMIESRNQPKNRAPLILRLILNGRNCSFLPSNRPAYLAVSWMTALKSLEPLFSPCYPFVIFRRKIRQPSQKSEDCVASYQMSSRLHTTP